MGFADLLWDSGKDNMGGIVGEIYFCPVEDIESLPALSAVGSLQTAVDDIVCKAGTKFYRLYHTAETGKLDTTTVGELDGKSKMNMLTFFYPGDDATLAAQVRLLQNTPGVYICKDSKGRLRLLGVTHFEEGSTELSLESPAYVQITNGTLGAAGADRKGTTFEVVHKAPHRAVFYMGEVPIATYSDESEAVFANMDSQPPTALKNAISRFVDSQVTAGNWNKVIDFGYLGLNTEANSLKGFKGVADPVLSDAVWNSYEGLHTKGTISSFMSFGFIPNANIDFEVNNAGIGAHIHVNQSTGSAALMGAIESGVNTRQILIQQTGSQTFGRINAGNSNITDATDGILDNDTFYAIKRTASGALQLVKNSTEIATGAVVSVGKSAITPFLGGRNFDGVSSLPMKASYKYWVIFKAVDFDLPGFLTAANQLIADIEYPKVRILALGDSIARGTSNGTTTAVPHTLKEYNGTNLADVTADVSAAVTGSPYPSLASRLFSLSGRVTHLIPYAEGGSEFSPNGDTNNWSTTGIRYATMKTRADAYLATQPAGTTFDIIRITLGVNDARGSADVGTINTDAVSLIDRLTTDFPTARIVINQLGKSDANVDRIASVRATIDNLVSTYPNVYAGTDLDTYPTEAFYDGLHLTQEYNNQLGEDDAQVIADLL